MGPPGEGASWRASCAGDLSAGQGPEISPPVIDRSWSLRAEPRAGGAQQPHPSAPGDNSHLTLPAGPSTTATRPTSGASPRPLARSRRLIDVLLATLGSRMRRDLRLNQGALRVEDSKLVASWFRAAGRVEREMGAELEFGFEFQLEF